MATTTSAPSGPSRRCLRSTPARAPRAGSVLRSATRSPQFASTRRRPTTTARAGIRLRRSLPRTPLMPMPRRPNDRARDYAVPRRARASRAATRRRGASSIAVRISPNSPPDHRRTSSRPRNLRLNFARERRDVEMDSHWGRRPHRSANPSHVGARDGPDRRLARQCRWARTASARPVAGMTSDTIRAVS